METLIKEKVQKKGNTQVLLPVLLGFFVMGFCDVVGISASYVKEDLLNAHSPAFRDTLSNLIPVALFSMFLFFSIPTGILMNKIGQKKTVLLSYIITSIAMVIPLISYTFIPMLIAFALLGIANTILQVSLNPLLTNIVSKEQATSSLTAGQFIKAISSFSAPFIATGAALYLGSWKYIFPIYAGISIISGLWLNAAPVEREASSNNSSSFSDVFNILKDSSILLLFLSIVAVVGLDVGMNTIAPKLLMDKAGLELGNASYGASIYFAFRTLGAFTGAFLLSKVCNVKFFRANILIGLAAICLLYVANSQYAFFALYAFIGFTLANVFPIIFSKAIEKRPDKKNEISGLMITGVFGGAIIPFLMGLTTDYTGSQNGAITILILSICYLIFVSFKLSTSKK